MNTSAQNSSSSLANAAPTRALTTVLILTLLGMTPPATAQSIFNGSTSDQWNEAGNWSADVPVSSTDVQVRNTQTIIVPSAIGSPATARSLTISTSENDEDGHSDQSVILSGGMLNLTPIAGNVSIKVGQASLDENINRGTLLGLDGVTLNSTGFAEIGTGLLKGGGGQLVAQVSLVNGAKWLHPAGLIELGGGNGKGSLILNYDPEGMTNLLAGSIIPGDPDRPDPSLKINSGSMLTIEYGAEGRFSEVSVLRSDRGLTSSPAGNIHFDTHSAMDIYGAFTSSKLSIGEAAFGRVQFLTGSNSNLGDVVIHQGNLVLREATSIAQSVTVQSGLLAVVQDSGAGVSTPRGGQMTIGTPNPADPYIPRLVLAKETGNDANLEVRSSNVTVHSNALLGGYGVATVNIERGELDIHGKAYLGQTGYTESGNLLSGSGTVTVTGEGAVLRAQNLEMGYTYGEYRGEPSPTGNLSISSGGRVEIAGSTESYSGYNWWTQQRETVTYNFAGNLINGKGGTIDFVDGTGKLVFTDPSNGGSLPDKPQLINTGMIKGGGTGPGPEAQIDFGTTGGTLNNKGTIDVGHSPGWLTVNGDVSFGGLGSFDGNGRLKIELGGTNAGLDYDVFEVWGNADFTGGTLELSFINGYTPLAGDYWDFLRVSGGITGWFSSFVVTEGYESYLTALQGWNGESNFRLHADDLGGGGGGSGGSSVPEGGTSGVLLSASFLGLMLFRNHKTSPSSARTKNASARS